MGTRGLVGIRDNKKLLIGIFEQYDTYYEGLGEGVVESYFRFKGEEITKLVRSSEENKEFLSNGLFCEYAYIYNKENDTLEIYRGYFKFKQGFDTKTKILNILEEGKDGKEDFYCHLIFIIDRKKHTQEQVLRAFKSYDKNDDEEKEYPEREIISLKLPKGYLPLKEISKSYRSQK